LATERIIAMKIALCISGQARKVSEGFKGIKKNIIDVNNQALLDIFIHVWEERKDISNIPDSLLNHEVQGQKCTVSFNTVLENPSKLISIYDPTSHIIEKQVPFDPLKFEVPKNLGWKSDGRPCFNQQSMFYSIWACNNLKKMREISCNFVYDAVIRIRPDCRVAYPVDISKLDLNKLYHRGDTPPGHIDSRAPDWPGKMNDHFAISSSKNMDIYSSCYLNLDDLYKAGVPFNPEFNLGAWIDSNKIERAIVKYNELYHHVATSAIIR